jgi:hypothetical protein
VGQPLKTARPGELGGEAEPSEQYISRGRQTGAVNADELADLIHAARIPSADLSNVTTEHWRDLARAKGRDFAIGRAAQNKLIRDVINAVRLRQA